MVRFTTYMGLFFFSLGSSLRISCTSMRPTFDIKSLMNSCFWAMLTLCYGALSIGQPLISMFSFKVDAGIFFFTGFFTWFYIGNASRPPRPPVPSSPAGRPIRFVGFRLTLITLDYWVLPPRDNTFCFGLIIYSSLLLPVLFPWNLNGEFLSFLNGSCVCFLSTFVLSF